MVTTPGAAASAYQALARLNDGVSGSSPIGIGNKPAGGDFASLVRDSIGAVAQQAHQAETQSRAFANGKADLVNVVTAVAESEVALETLVSVRDRVINAYEEILRMPI
ncbi:flagellar hook-basal body complex protein FliE [Candidatus Raskinella chloraquaticus]|jgi:flagellar hook-basal body complex protein FliE|uniref:Flagellar hook-basal body complex protein FliE n=1 Tax=Candidatus Raskinella chloraquaticus TaxID=1951219 RepID=A0A1W9I2F0_9HYPH|nr:MAG: hypothetical protein A4S15_04865 [Proteobacteria bacterium SG_bin8]